MRGGRKILGFVKIEELGGGRMRYVGGWMPSKPLVFGEGFDRESAPEEKLKMLRLVSRRLRAIPKPEAVE